MPNRIIKDSLLTSEKIADLTDFEFRLWVSMILLVDDAGRGDARPAIIRGRAFPLRERVTLKDIETAVHGLAAKGCVDLYTVGGRPYFWFPTWSDHQRIREVKPKYPAPEDADALPQSAAVCGNPPQSAASCRELRPESESNPNPNPNPNPTPTRTGARGAAFDAFWAAYPRKVGKQEARKAWEKVPVEAFPRIVPAIEAQKKSAQWQKDDGQFIPYPATWLNRGSWDDESPDTPAQTGSGNVFVQLLEKGAFDDA